MEKVSAGNNVVRFATMYRNEKAHASQHVSVRASWV